VKKIAVCSNPATLYYHTIILASNWKYLVLNNLLHNESDFFKFFYAIVTLLTILVKRKNNTCKMECDYLMDFVPQDFVVSTHCGINLLISAWSSFVINLLSNANCVYAGYWISGLVKPLPIAKPCHNIGKKLIKMRMKKQLIILSRFVEISLCHNRYLIKPWDL